jgi:hypothetical protein
MDGSIVGAMEVLALVVLGLFFYFLPSLIGSGKRNAGAIFVLNLFTGWSFIGWVIALVWASMAESQVIEALKAPETQETIANPQASRTWIKRLIAGEFE